jgi:Uma2 family endonuclease
MSSVTIPPLPPGSPPEPPLRISVNQYHLMINSGVFADDEAVELLEGWLMPKMPKKPPHNLSTGLVGDSLTALLPPGWHIDCQGSVTTSDSEPEPDIGVVRGNRRDYQDGHPKPNDLGMVVEVSDTTLARDRGMKKRVFARANIAVFWIVNLVDMQVEVYTDPSGPADQPDYRQKQIFKPGDSIPVILDGKQVGKVYVDAILP